MKRVREAEKLKLFISYSRHDAVAADALVDALETHGFEVMIDRRDLPFGEKWQAELAEFIRLSDTAIWLVSEHSVRSEWVNWELDEVAKRSKRLVPVMIGELPRAKLPRQLGEIHILPADGLFSLARDLDTLVQVMETDHGWLKDASRLQDRAAEWLAKNRSPTLLLSRGALAAAERWKEGRPAKAPLPAKEVLDLLLASRQAVTRLQRWLLVGSAAITAFALALAGFAYLQRNSAIEQKNAALITQSEFLIKASTDELKSDHPTVATLLALEALPKNRNDTRPWLPQADAALYKALLRNRERLILNGLPEGVNLANFDPSGEKIITAGYGDSAATIWRAADGLQLARLPHHGPLSYAEFDPQGKHVATSSYDKTVKLWSAEPIKELFSLPHKEHALWAAFDRTGSKVVTGSYVGEVVVWDVRTGVELNRLVGNSLQVRFVTFDDTGQKVLSLDDDGTARVWAWDGAGEILRIAAKEWRPKSAVFDPSGNQVLIVSTDGTVRIWSIISKTESIRLEVPGDEIVAAAYDKSGKYIAGGLKSGTSRIWTASGQLSIDMPSRNSAIMVEQPDLNKNARDSGGISLVAFDQSGEKLLAASGQVVTVWNTRSGDLIARLSGHTKTINSAYFDVTGNQVVTASSDGTARLWMLGHARNVSRLEHEESYRWILNSALSIDTKRGVIFSSEIGQIWDLDTNRPIAPLRGHAHYVDLVLFASQGKKIITGSRGDRAVRIWDASNGAPLKEIKDFGPYPEISIDISPDHHMFATSPHDDGSVRIWDTEDERRSIHLVSTNSSLSKPFFDSTGTRVGALSQDQIFTWDIQSGLKKFQVKLYNGILLSAQYAADGKKIAVASQNGTITVLNSDNGIEIKTIQVDIGSIKFIMMNSSGNKILVLAPMGAAVFDIDTGAQIGQAFKNKQPFQLKTANFFGSDDRVMVSTDGGPVWLWHVSSGEIIAEIAEGYSSSEISSRDSELVLLTQNGHLYKLKQYPEGRALIQLAQKNLPRCLTLEERQAFFVAHQDGSWCKASSN